MNTGVPIVLKFFFVCLQKEGGTYMRTIMLVFGLEDIALF
jgi:hypothetical protein